MQKTLCILEVSQKQNYIYQEKQLTKNAQRSQEIAYVTDDLFFQRAAGEVYDRARNLGYSGGGHTILQFDTQEEAVRFNRLVTGKARQLFPKMELFAATLSCDDKDPGDALKRLTEVLEAKKSRRQGAFRYLGLGMEIGGRRIDPPTPAPQILEEINSLTQPAPEGRKYAAILNYKDENFIGVVHIDGNAMGKRVQALYDRRPKDLDDMFAMLRTFSESIQQHYSEAFLEMAQVVARNFPDSDVLPLRPVVMAGDDVCFACRGDIALECARIFMDKLAAKCNAQDGRPYAACAGIALVHNRYPFFRAYALSEELCGSAKQYSSALNSDGSVCAMDWHIEYGQMKEHLDEIRRDYLDSDGTHLELRPMVAAAAVHTPEYRRYQRFRELVLAFRRDVVPEDRIAKSSLKNMRNFLKQGEEETNFYLTDRSLQKKLAKLFPGRGDMPELYCTEGSIRHSRIFDVIEISDHFRPLEGGL